MAEFAEVMRQKKRMCNHIGNCFKCPLFPGNNGKHLLCDTLANRHPDIAEALILEWAAEHPEPKYPTWREWHKAEFPDAAAAAAPCHFMSRDECCKGYHCRNCDTQPIPAHIAEKLGIEPIKED